MAKAVCVPSCAGQACLLGSKASSPPPAGGLLGLQCLLFALVEALGDPGCSVCGRPG